MYGRNFRIIIAEQRQLKTDVAHMESDVAKGEEVTADFQAFLANARKIHIAEPPISDPAVHTSLSA